MANPHPLLVRSSTRIRNPLLLISKISESFARAHDVHEHPLVSQLLGNLRSGSFGSATRVADSIGSQLYTNPANHFAMNQLASFVKKVPFKDPSLTPEETAWKKFLAAEHACKRSNQRFCAERTSTKHAARHRFLRDRAREWIKGVIGLKPNLTSIYEGCDFGPGSSIGVHGQATHKAAKLCSDTWTCTPSAQGYALSGMMGDHHLWELLSQREMVCYDPDLFRSAFYSKVELCTSNKIVMVPKTAKVHRTIAIEPLLNGYVQKGVDVFLRKKLRRVGLDLNDQIPNQFLAKEGSEGGPNPFATIDLSAASDSISIEVVRDLLPADWFTFLNSIRSPTYESEWGSGRYEKFTSMGNGFCFPLETLIFASLAYSVGVETGCPDFRVYGDDIIVRQSAALYLIEILKFYGFQTNTDKTFIFGPFRESCGADYFEGVNVRPYNLDFIPVSDRDIYKIYNGLRENSFFVTFKSLEEVCALIPFEDRLMRPIIGPPDTAMSVPLDIFMSSRFAKWCKGIQSWTWLEYQSIAIPDNRRPPAAVQMYGLLRGQRSSWNGAPEFAFRRKTRTVTRYIPSDPVT
jgi:hypothetical protein